MAPERNSIMGLLTDRITLQMDDSRKNIVEKYVFDVKKMNIEIAVTTGYEALVNGNIKISSGERRTYSKSVLGKTITAFVYQKGRVIEAVSIPFFAGQHTISLDTDKTAKATFALVGNAEVEVDDLRALSHYYDNTVSLEDLMRLGFSEKQARAIDNYRQKGGRFRRPSDFAKSFVVSDSVFKRLEKYIDIPRTDINRADSAAFDALPGIGPYFAAKMVEYRARLGGYSYPEQLMDIYHFDREKYDGLSDLICCSRPREPFRIWSLPEDSLRLHPYIRTRQAAHSIVLLREHTPREQWTLETIAGAGILPEEDASRLLRCVVAAP